MGIDTQRNTQTVITENIVISGIPTLSLSASIDTNYPERINYSFVVLDSKTYFNNRNEIHERQNSFEDEVYNKQQEMLLEA